MSRSVSEVVSESVVVSRGRIDGRLVPAYARPWRDAAPVRRWRERVASSTFPTYFGYMYRFLRGIGKDPETALFWGRETPDKYTVLDAIKVPDHGGLLRYLKKLFTVRRIRQ